MRIKVGLDPKSIESAIKEIKKHRGGLKDKVAALIEILTEGGVEIAKAEIRQMGAIYTGELEESITGYFSPALGVGIIKTDCPYAVYVEYGTGVVGKENPHPAPEGWQYDMNQRGEKGWWYFNERDKKWHWTKGMESRPFMYNTFLELQRLVEEQAKVVFKHDRYRK